MSADAANHEGVVLRCQPVRDGDALVFPYRIENDTGADIFVFDALVLAGPEPGKAIVDRNMAAIALAPDQFAQVMRGIAPLPIDRKVLVRLIPLAAKVPPGASLERRLEIGMPLHETDPYHHDLPIREYRQRTIAGVTLVVQYLRSDAPGFSATPSEFAPDLYRVASADTVGAAQSVSCRLPARGLSILQRTDKFPRPQE